MILGDQLNYVSIQTTLHWKFMFGHKPGQWLTCVKGESADGRGKTWSFVKRAVDVNMGSDCWKTTLHVSTTNGKP